MLRNVVHLLEFMCTRIHNNWFIISTYKYNVSSLDISTEANKIGTKSDVNYLGICNNWANYVKYHPTCNSTIKLS